MKRLFLSLSLSLCSVVIANAQHVVTLTATAPVNGSGASDPLVLQTNQVATLLHAFVPTEDALPQCTPSTAVVIPTDATGPVRIVLESSTDLQNWNDALPGTYGSTTTNRFFRVRAVRQ